jgi:effector-binding domain-containing protein
MYLVEQKKYPKQEVITIRTRDSLYSMGKYIGQLYKRAKKANLKVTGPIFCIYYEEPKDPKNVDFEMCLPIEGESDLESKRIGGELCLYLRVKGSYKQFPEAYKALTEYVSKHKIELAGSPREVYVKGPLLGFLTFIPRMITDIYFPMKE